MTVTSPILALAARPTRVVVTVCMVVAPALLLVSNVLRPARRRDVAAQLDVLADHRTRWVIAHLLEFGFAPLFAVVIVGLAGLARPGRGRLAVAGAVLALAGLAGFTGHVALDIASYSMTDRGRDRAQMVQLLDTLLNHSPAFVAYSLVPFLLLAPGLVLLAVAAAGSDWVAGWAAWCVAVGPVLFVVHWVLASAVLAVAGSALLTAGLWSVGRSLLTTD